MNARVTYRQQISYCGKPGCRKCRDGIGHGPYWYAYSNEQGRITRTYIGKQLPPGLQGADVQSIADLPGADLNQPALRVRVLGEFRLERRNGQAWQRVAGAVWEQPQVRTLLGRLLTSPQRTLERGRAVAALWPKLDEETATRRLNRTVHSLRQLLEPAPGRSATSQLLLSEHDVLSLADQAHIEVDADTFDDLLARASATTDLEQHEDLLEQALTVYGGDFLPEERQAMWASERRQALKHKWMDLLLELADRRIACGAFAGVIDLLDLLLVADPTNEGAVQRLMVALAQSKRRAEALRAYQRLASLLQQIYARAPAAETRSLYEAVRQGEEPVIKAPPMQIRQTSLEVPEVRLVQQIGRSHQSPLVGREQELETLRRFLFAAERPVDSKKALDHAQFVLLMGETGIGKTRLAEELSRKAQQRGWMIVWSKVYAQEGSAPYQLWTEVLRNAMSSGLWPHQEISKRPQAYQPLLSLLPELHGLLPQPAPLLPPDPGQEQLQLWESVGKLLTSIGNNSPFLLVLDDLQWTDQSSIELLGHLARHLRDYPVIFLGTCREPELPVSHPLRDLVAHLHRERSVEVLHIRPLTDAQIGELVAHLPEPTVQQIQERAAGNPFFAEELAHFSARSPSRSVEPHAALDAPSALPGTITAALDYRIGKLSSTCRQLLSNAAVLGGAFEFHLVHAMEAYSANLNEDTILDLLDEALQAGVLTEEGSGTRITYSFWHPLLVSHLYNGISAARRIRLHRRVADVLRQVYSEREEERSATITHHLLKGGADTQEIAHYAELAGDHAYRLSAYPEAERHYRLAVERIELFPAKTRDERLHRAYLLERLGECTMVLGDFAEARHLHERTLEERSKIEVLPAESQQEAQLQALIWGEIGWTWRYTGSNARARECCERGEHILREAGVLAGSAWARLRFQQASISWQEGIFDQARRTAYEALMLFEETLQREIQPAGSAYPLTRMRRTLAGDPVDLGRTHRLLGSIINGAGQPEEALTHLNMALAIYEQHHHERETAHVSCNMGYVCLKKGENEPAQAFLRRALSLAERLGDTPLMSVVYSNLGELAARSGNLAEAETRYTHSLTLMERINDREYLSLWHAALAAVLQQQGKFAEAGVYLRRALSIGRAMHNAPCIGFALLALGNLRIAQAATGENEGDTRFLERARATLRRVLILPGLESDTRTECHLAQAYVLLLFGELDVAYQEAMHALEDARHYELTWTMVRCQRLLGSILAALGREEEAHQYFEQALRTQRRCGMRLEYARTLHDYGKALLHGSSPLEPEHEQGLKYLHEARQLFSECGATNDLQAVERMLAVHHHS